MKGREALPLLIPSLLRVLCALCVFAVYSSSSSFFVSFVSSWFKYVPFSRTSAQAGKQPFTDRFTSLYRDIDQARLH
jgi:hypothetical protein